MQQDPARAARTGTPGHVFVINLENRATTGCGLPGPPPLIFPGRCGHKGCCSRIITSRRQRVRFARAESDHQPLRKKGYIDHQTLSHDAYIKFIEDDFLHGQRIDPATDERPDPPAGVRENNPLLGDRTKAFDFNQPPLPPFILNNATTY